MHMRTAVQLQFNDEDNAFWDWEVYKYAKWSFYAL
jgi:hypothetical protein